MFSGDVPAGREPGSVDRGEEATGGAIEGESSVLPGRALTHSREPLHVAPDGARIRLVLLSHCVRLGGLLLRDVDSLHDRIDDRLLRLTEFPGGGPQDRGPLQVGIGVEGGADVLERRGPCLLNRRRRAGAGNRRRVENPR